MLLEILGCTAMGSLLGWTYLDKSSTTDASKIQRVANNCGLFVKEDKKKLTMHLLKRRKHSWGTVYVYRIPLGLSFTDFQQKRQHMEDGLNHKRRLLDINFEDIKTLRMQRDLFVQIRQLLSNTKHRKEIMMEYDGTLLITVYKEPMPTLVPYVDSIASSCKGWMICVGESREGTIFHDFDKMPHMIIAGTTRYGKSVFLKNTITTLIHTQPENARFTLVDLKGGLAFNRFANVRQVDTVAKDINEALTALRSLHSDLQQRQALFLANRYEDITEAKAKHRNFIVIDEAAELASQGEPDAVRKKIKVECEHLIAEIARIGGGLGYRLIFATQYPTADTLPRQVKQNSDAKLCFRLQTETASRVVLDEAGAESLPLIKGRAIYQTDRKHVVQTPYIQNDHIDRVIGPHIIIKPRKEVNPDAGNAKKETGETRVHTLVIEET